MREAEEEVRRRCCGDDELLLLADVELRSERLVIKSSGWEALGARFRCWAMVCFCMLCSSSCVYVVVWLCHGYGYARSVINLCCVFDVRCVQRLYFYDAKLPMCRIFILSFY